MKPEAITTVEEAIAFLETIDIEVIGTDGGWIVHGIGRSNDDIELTCDSVTDLLDYAHAEHDILTRMCDEIGVDSIAQLPITSSCSPVAECRMNLLSAWTNGLTSGKGGKK